MARESLYQVAILSFSVEFDHARHFVELDRGAVAIGHHDVAVIGRVAHGAGGEQRHRLVLALQGADRRARIGLGDHAADIVERDITRGRRHRIDLHAHGEFLRAVDQHLRDARQLRDLRRQHRLGVVVHRRQLHGVGAHAHIEHREIARIDLTEERRRGHFHRQAALRHRQRGLHVERGAVDIAAKVELHGDLRGTEPG